MGNAGSSGTPRDRRHKFREVVSCSPIKEGQAFIFDKKSKNKVRLESLQEEEEEVEVPYFTEPIVIREQPRPRSNTGSSGAPRERHHKLSEVVPCSPIKEGQAFVFDKKPESKVQFQSLQEEEVPYFTKPIPVREQPRPRSNTVSEGTPPSSSRATHTPTVFRWEGGGKNVYISGSFSNWQTIPMVKSYGDFVAIVDLPEGEHQYKFYVDGEWKNDMSNKIVEDDSGAKNNLISVKQSDFEVFQALAKDSENIKDDSQKEFGQEVPANKPWEKTSGPPILPPHLLQVILNKDTPLSCEPTLLPEPIHVMLNHLYALSIKDGVMVLSATHRYRKKYVTTLLYKPI